MAGAVSGVGARPSVLQSGSLECCWHTSIDTVLLPHLLLLGLLDELVNELLSGLGSVGFFPILLPPSFLSEETSSSKVGGGQLSWMRKKEKFCHYYVSNLYLGVKNPAGAGNEPNAVMGVAQTRSSCFLKPFVPN